jgi:hypothetical protein
LTLQWQTNLGGRLSSPVVASDRVFVASIDQHKLHALDGGSGEGLWQFTAGGRIDSPPTVYSGLLLFGSADGWVYCLRASDGELVWKYQAAPLDLRLVAFEQVESVWPVHGSVLIQDGIAYCVAGRSMFLDGGMRLLRLDPVTGERISETVLDDRDPETGENLQVRVDRLNMPVALADILSSDGQSIYMRSQRFDLEGVRQELGPIDVTKQEGPGVHLFCPVGFLDNSWFHRSFFLYGRSTSAGWGGWFRAGRYVPSGRLLVFDEESVYGFGRKPEYVAQSSVLEYALFSTPREIKNDSILRVIEEGQQINEASDKRNPWAADWKLRQQSPLSARTAVDFRWRLENIPLLVRAMVLADKILFVAGPPDLVDEEESFFRPDDEEIRRKLQAQDAALQGDQGALLWAVSAADGKKLSEFQLDSLPVFDGMVATECGLYLSMSDGSIACYRGSL